MTDRAAVNDDELPEPGCSQIKLARRMLADLDARDRERHSPESIAAEERAAWRRRSELAALTRAGVPLQGRLARLLGLVDASGDPVTPGPALAVVPPPSDTDSDEGDEGDEGDEADEHKAEADDDEDTDDADDE